MTDSHRRTFYERINVNIDNIKPVKFFLRIGPAAGLTCRIFPLIILVRAVRSRNPKAASAAMKRHLESLGKELVNLERVYRKIKGLAL